MQLIIMKETRNAFKGDIIEVRASGTPLPGATSPFVAVEIPTVPIAAWEQYNSPWHLEVGFEVVAQNVSIDGFRIRLYSETTNGVMGAVTKDQAEAFINSWGGTVFSFGANEVVFDIKIYDALVSAAFWDEIRDDLFPQIVFSELSYDSETGLHRIEADYSALSINPTAIERYLIRRHMTAVSHANRVLVFDGDRTLARTEFQNDLKEKLRRLVAKKRYRVSDAVVDYIVSQGGHLETDAATLLTYIKDKVTE